MQAALCFLNEISYKLYMLTYIYLCMYVILLYTVFIFSLILCSSRCHRSVLKSLILVEHKCCLSNCSFYLYRLYVEEGLPDRSIIINCKGSGGQSFCAFLAKGVHVTLEGDANDYVGKVS